MLAVCTAESGSAKHTNNCILNHPLILLVARRWCAFGSELCWVLSPGIPVLRSLFLLELLSTKNIVSIDLLGLKKKQVLHKQGWGKAGKHVIV